MHPYATDSNERERVFSLIAVVTVGLVWLLHWALSAFYWWWNPVTIMGLYGLLYLLFDKLFWGNELLRKVRLVKVPNLNGTWKGELSSSRRRAAKQEAAITIRQTWTRLSVVFETENSRSHSLIASILTGQPGGPVLSYEYLSEPKPGAKDASIQKGSARLTLQGDRLEGTCFSGYGKQHEEASLHFQKTPA